MLMSVEMNLRHYVPGVLLGCAVGLAVAFGLYAYDHVQWHEMPVISPAVVPIEPPLVQPEVKEDAPFPHYRFTKITPVGPQCSCAPVGGRKVISRRKPARKKLRTPGIFG
jgi:hypothetical protein